jgi:hypothetical protein
LKNEQGIIMLNKYTQHIGLYLEWIRSAIAAVSKETVYTYRLVKYYVVDSTDIVVIQVVGKNLFFTKKIVELVDDEVLLQGFSAQDVKYMCFLAFHKLQSPMYYISSTILDETKQPLFEIRQVNASGTCVMTPHELLQSSIFPNDFSKKDVLHVGFILGETSLSA